MKKSLAAVIALLILCAVCFTGCSAPEDDAFDLDTSKLKLGTHTFATRMVNGDQAIEYNTVYTVTKPVAEGVEYIRIESNGERKGETIYSCNDLMAKGNDSLTALTPVKISMEYHNAENSQTDVLVDVEHKHGEGNLVISLQQYADGAIEMSTSTYTVMTGKQYYDSETLPFVIGCLPLKKDLSLNFTLSSSNRDALQSMNISVIEVSMIDINGTEEECYCAVVRPNTMFTNYATYMYYRTSDQQLVKIVQDNVTFTLVDHTELPAED